MLGVITASPLSFGTQIKAVEGSASELTGRPEYGLQQGLASVLE